MEFDPYAALGINRQADAKTIKKAYRKKAAAAHPDRGGSVEAFAEVKRAYDQLNGRGSEPKLDDPVIQQAMQVLTMELGEVTRSATSLRLIDVPAMMRNKIGAGLEQCMDHVSKTTRRLEAARDLRSRFEVKTGKPDYIGQILDYEIRECEMILAKQNHAIEGIKMALALLGDYTYRRDNPPKTDGFGRFVSTSPSYPGARPDRLLRQRSAVGW